MRFLTLFRYNPNNDNTTNQLNKINLQAREEMYREGLALFNYCYINEKLSIRFIFANPEVMESDIDYILETFESKCVEQI